ncbi:hypothetical protein [Streptomyces prunicolor]|uniref:Uncharacterized protein n=1 Tax=Streptomyces prunicolor TaxID=67348 RepID=A0ABU4FQ27_9ACTN|nr:hypothetical protein [Streptomyces prunicolor]MDV7222716.1 hypothetical protein [Streptomyces prunicolor]
MHPPILKVEHRRPCQQRIRSALAVVSFCIIPADHHIVLSN